MSAGKQSPKLGLGYFKSFVDDLQERLASLENFDSAAEIDAYCDELEGQVALTFDSIVRHLHELQDKITSEIKEYRERRLACLTLDLSEVLPQAKRMKIEPSCEGSSWIQTELNSVSRSINDLNKTYGFCVKVADKYPQLLQNKVEQGEALKERLGILRQLVREEAYGGEFLKFKPNQWSIQHMDLLGKLETSSHEQEADKHSSNSMINISEKPYLTLTSHSEPVLSVKFLSNGLLATCASDLTIRLWNHVTEREQVLRSPSRGSISDLIELPDGRLIGGSATGDMVLWNKAYQVIKCVDGHKQIIISVLLLPNDNVASLCMDDTLKIWHGLEENDLRILYTMSGHGALCMLNRLAILPSGFLVTCSDDMENCKVRIWDPYQGKIVREIETHLNLVSSFALLRNNDLVLVPDKAPLHVINLDDETRRKSLPGTERGRNACWFILELANGHILLENADDEHYLEIWNPESGELIQSVKASHSGFMVSFSFSRDGRILATGSEDSTVNLWTLSCN